jgi:hypothetical protein
MTASTACVESVYAASCPPWASSYRLGLLGLGLGLRVVRLLRLVALLAARALAGDKGLLALDRLALTTPAVAFRLALAGVLVPALIGLFEAHLPAWEALGMLL